MTTIAMVIGMLPIALASGAGSEWKNALAIVMIGGLLSSLMLRVFIVPMVYLFVDTMKARFEKKSFSGASVYHEAEESQLNPRTQIH